MAGQEVGKIVMPKAVVRNSLFVLIPILFKIVRVTPLTEIINYDSKRVAEVYPSNDTA